MDVFDTPRAFAKTQQWIAIGETVFKAVSTIFLMLFHLGRWQKWLILIFVELVDFELLDTDFQFVALNEYFWLIFA